jgi:hypothetical protein
MLEIPSYSDELPPVGPPASEYEMAEALDAQTIQEVHLSKDELEIAIGLHLEESTFPGHWLFRGRERDRPLALLREETGASTDTVVKLSINQATESGLMEAKLSQTKRNWRLANIRLTPQGREFYTDYVTSHPDTLDKIKACQLAHIHKIIVMVRREVGHELDWLGIPRSDEQTKFVRLRELDDATKAKAHLGQLREVQQELLDKIEAADRRRRMEQRFRLPRAA